MTYRVTAPLVIAKDKEGRLHHVYEGGVIEWLSDEQAEQWLESGLVVESDSTPNAVDASDGKPKHVSPKADWVAYAVANGIDEAEAEAMTKQELIDALG